MKVNKNVFRSRGCGVMTLTLMLVVVGTVNYNLSKKSVLQASKEMEMYENQQLAKNNDKKEAKVVDSKETVVNEKAKEMNTKIAHVVRLAIAEFITK